MPIPKDILSVERPKSTIVRKMGNYYYVIKRTSKYKEGKRIPVDLGIVGKLLMENLFLNKKIILIKKYQ